MINRYYFLAINAHAQTSTGDKLQVFGLNRLLLSYFVCANCESSVVT